MDPSEEATGSLDDDASSSDGASSVDYISEASEESTASEAAAAALEDVIDAVERRVDRQRKAREGAVVLSCTWGVCSRARFACRAEPDITPAARRTDDFACACDEIELGGVRPRPSCAHDSDGRAAEQAIRRPWDAGCRESPLAWRLRSTPGGHLLTTGQGC